LHSLGHEDGGVELLEGARAVEAESVFVVLGDLQDEVGAAADAGQVLELVQEKAADAEALIAGVDGELLDEERAHVAVLEVTLVHPVVAADDLHRTLGITDDLGALLVVRGDLEEELLDALFLVDLDEALLRSRPLVLDGLAVHVAKAQLQELPHAVQIAAVDAADADRGAVAVLGSRDGRERL